MERQRKWEEYFTFKKLPPYANKFDNLDEMDKFLESHKLPKLTQEETETISL